MSVQGFAGKDKVSRTGEVVGSGTYSLTLLLSRDLGQPESAEILQSQGKLKE